MAKKITLLGSTGSIGTQSLDVIRAQGYEVFGLSAHSQTDKILQQIEEFHPKYVCMTSEAGAEKLSAALAGRADAPRLLTGPEGLKALAARINAFAVSEDLPAHGECVLSRFVKDPYDKATLREQEKEAGLR